MPIAFSPFVAIVPSFVFVISMSPELPPSPPVEPIMALTAAVLDTAPPPPPTDFAKIP